MLYKVLYSDKAIIAPKIELVKKAEGGGGPVINEPAFIKGMAGAGR
jgi:hypothetical protein